MVIRAARLSVRHEVGRLHMNVVTQCGRGGFNADCRCGAGYETQDAYHTDQIPRTTHFAHDRPPSDDRERLRSPPLHLESRNPKWIRPLLLFAPQRSHIGQDIPYLIIRERVRPGSHRSIRLSIMDTLEYTRICAILYRW